MSRLFAGKHISSPATKCDVVAEAQIPPAPGDSRENPAQIRREAPSERRPMLRYGPISLG